MSVLVRDSGKLPADLGDVRVQRGDARDPEAVAKTLVGCEAVLSTLGGFGDAASLDAGTAAICAAMRDRGIARLVVMQGYHLHFPDDPGNVGQRLVLPYLWLNDRSLIGASQAMADALLASDDIDWTVVRVPRIVPGGPTTGVRHGPLRLAPWSKVTVGDAAAAMLAVLGDPMTIRTAPMVAS